MCAVHVCICTHHECEVDKIEMQAIASPAYTSVAMTTPMGCRPQCEDGTPPKYMNVNNFIQKSDLSHLGENISRNIFGQIAKKIANLKPREIFRPYNTH